MEVKLPGLLGNYNRPTDRPNEQTNNRNGQTDSHREASLQIILPNNIERHRINFQIHTYIKEVDIEFPFR